MGHGEGRKRLKAREAGPSSLQPACHRLSAADLFCVHVLYMLPLQSFRVCYPMDCSLPGSSLNGSLLEEYWSGLPFPPPGNPLDPGFKHKSPVSPALQVDSLPTEPPGKP